MIKLDETRKDSSPETFSVNYGDKIKLKCVANRNGYERSLTTGKEYEIADIQKGMFPGDYYIIIDKEHTDNGKSASCLDYRFEITKEQCKKYVLDSFENSTFTNTYKHCGTEWTTEGCGYSQNDVCPVCNNFVPLWSSVRVPNE